MALKRINMTEKQIKALTILTLTTIPIWMPLYIIWWFIKALCFTFVVLPYFTIKDFYTHLIEVHNANLKVQELDTVKTEKGNKVR